MTYNSELKNGSDLNSVEIPEACRNNELSVNPDLYVKYECMDDNGLRELFDQVLSFVLKEVSVKKNAIRPFPPKLGDGVEADLFKLFLTVKRIGSYEIVSENNLWEFVAKECGFEIGVEASLKLLYAKYLKELDQWLIEGGFKENVDNGVIEKLDLLSHQLDEYICFESNQIQKSLCDNEIIGLKDEGTSGFNQNEQRLNLDKPFSRINDDNDDDEEFRVKNDKRCELSSRKVVKKVLLSDIKDVVVDDDDDDDDDEKFSIEDEKQIESSINVVVNDIIRCHSDNNVVMNAKDDNVSNVVKNVSSCMKRRMDKKSLLLSEMIDWVATAARNPHDRVLESSRRSTKWKKHSISKLWNQALLSRRALFAENNFDSGNESKGSQKKNQKMHPAMYEDDNRLSTEVKRCTKSATSAQPCTCTSCNLRTSSRMKRPRAEPVKFRMQESMGPQDQKYNNLGPLHQAQVPPWTGVVSQSDPKWLGTQMWPPPDETNEEHEKGSLVIGQGRQNLCECIFSGSAECVRFHIAENRYKLKLELGDLFYKWKFNQMGEEVSLSWELEEEKVFKSLVVKARYDLSHSNKSRHEIMNKFWKRGAYIIRDKTKQNLVSYYFNVFVLRRRSYQNRVTPKEIDSDNDEEEVGSVGDRFGYEKIHGLLLTCSENMQCRDLES